MGRCSGRAIETSKGSNFLRGLERRLAVQAAPPCKDQRLRHGATQRVTGARDDEQIRREFQGGNPDRMGEVVGLGDLVAEGVVPHRVKV